MKFVIFLSCLGVAMSAMCTTAKVFPADAGTGYMYLKGGYKAATCDTATGKMKADGVADKQYASTDLDADTALHASGDAAQIDDSKSIAKYVGCAAGYKGTAATDCSTAATPAFKGCVAAGDCSASIAAVGDKADAHTATAKTQGSAESQACKSPCTGTIKYTCGVNVLGSAAAWNQDYTTKCTCPSWTWTPAKCELPKCGVAESTRTVACSTGTDADCAAKFGNGAKATGDALKCPAASTTTDCKDPTCNNADAGCVKTGTTGTTAAGGSSNGMDCTLVCGTGGACSMANKEVKAKWVAQGSSGGGDGSGSTMNSAFAVVALIFAYLW